MYLRYFERFLLIDCVWTSSIWIKLKKDLILITKYQLQKNKASLNEIRFNLRIYRPVFCSNKLISKYILKRYLTRSEGKPKCNYSLKTHTNIKRKKGGKKQEKKEKRKNPEIHFFQISSNTFQESLQDPIWMLISTSKIFKNPREWIFKPNIWNGFKQNLLKEYLLQSNKKIDIMIWKFVLYQ